jgi:hypothetical protein
MKYKAACSLLKKRVIRIFLLRERIGHEGKILTPGACHCKDFLCLDTLLSFKLFLLKGKGGKVGAGELPAVSATLARRRLSPFCCDRDIAARICSCG